MAAWVRETELVARGLEVADFNEKRLMSSLDEMRRYSRIRADEIMEPVQAICARAGVAVVWVPELHNTGISGCARWLTEKTALIGLTLRYKTDDQLWFTFFHEIGHILLHRNKRSFVLDNAAEDLSDHVVDPEMHRYEEEASRFSADTLIPRARSRISCGRAFSPTTPYTISRKPSASGRGSSWAGCNMTEF